MAIFRAVLLLFLLPTPLTELKTTNAAQIHLEKWLPNFRPVTTASCGAQEVKDRVKTSLIGVLAAVLIVAAVGSVYLLQPTSAATHNSTSVSSTTARPCVQKAYVDGQLYCFNVERAITNATNVQLGEAQVLMIATYPQLNSLCSANLAQCAPQTLPSGYSPQCDPCTVEAPSVYHDHILTGLPSGANGTYAVVIVAYAPSFSSQAGFAPMKSTSAVSAGENAGDFARINPNGMDPYEMPTRTILVLSVYPAS